MLTFENDILIFQDNYNVLHIASMHSREDVVKLLLGKKGVDPYSTGGVSPRIIAFFNSLPILGVETVRYYIKVNIELYILIYNLFSIDLKIHFTKVLSINHHFVRVGSSASITIQ